MQTRVKSKVELVEEERAEQRLASRVREMEAKRVRVRQVEAELRPIEEHFGKLSRELKTAQDIIAAVTARTDPSVLAKAMVDAAALEKIVAAAEEDLRTAKKSVRVAEEAFGASRRTLIQH